MRKSIIGLLGILLLAVSANAQTVASVSISATQFTTATPKPVIQTTGDTALPSNGSKIVLTAGAVYGYSIPIQTAGSYSLSTRIDGPATLHFEMPLGTRITSEVNAASTAWTTYSPTDQFSLAVGNQTVYLVVDTIGAGVPAANWIIFTYIPPPVITLNVSGSILFDDGTAPAITSTLTVQQANTGGFVSAGNISNDGSGNLTGTFVVNPALVNSSGFVTFQFTLTGIGATVNQTFLLQEFQQGSTGVNLQLVLFKSVLLPKSFGAGLLP